MERLQELEHRPIALIEETRGYVHLVVSVDANEIVVIRAMMDGAEAEAIRDAGGGFRMGVASDMCSIQQPPLLTDRSRTALRTRV